MYTLQTATGKIDVYGDPPTTGNSHKRFIVPAELIDGEDIEGTVTGTTEFTLPDQVDLTAWNQVMNGNFGATPELEYVITNDGTNGFLTFTKAPILGDSVIIIYKPL